MQLNGEIGDTATCVELIRCDDGLGWADLDAARAGTTVIVLCFGRGEFEVGE